MADSTPTQKSNPCSPLIRRRFPKPIAALGEWFNDLQLQHKIGWSFGLAIGVATVGVTAGWSVTEFYRSQAQADIEDSEAEHALLNDLQVKLLTTHLHQKGSILTLNDLSQWEGVYATFLADREDLSAAWRNYKATQGVVRGNTVYDQRERQLIVDLTASYEAFSKDSNNLIERLSQVEIKQLSDTELRALQLELTRLNNQVLRQDANRFINLVKELIDNSEIQLQQAKSASGKASIFQLEAIIISSLASLIIAIVLLFLMSRTISSSVKQAAATAEEVIETSNFDLQVPVTSSDEVGKLSVVLNRLIIQVKQLLKEEQRKANSLQRALGEVRSTQAALIQSEKMSALGQMVAGVAHEINNPVGFIHGNLGHVERYLQDLCHAIRLYEEHSSSLSDDVLEELEALEINFLMEDSKKVLKSMQMGTQRINEIVLSLRNFSRLDESDIKLVNIHQGIDNTLVILNHRLKANHQRPAIEVVKRYDASTMVECYAGQMNQVFMNILSNAIDAFEDINKARSKEEIEAKPNQILISTELTDQDQLKVRIKDNGPGIPERILDKLFDPFFTTKDVGKGTGLGLSISYKIVAEKHRGSLQCYSQPGQGTEFVIQLPIRQLKTQHCHAQTSKATVFRDGGKMLVS